MRGNRAALVVGASSAAFWAGLADAQRDIVRAVIADAGHAAADAPRALRLAADGIAQAALLRDAAFQRVVESGGPMTSSGRTRRAFIVWQVADKAVERGLRLVGLRRVPRAVGRFEDEVERLVTAQEDAGSGNPD